MNTVGALADSIVTYSYPDDTGRFSVTYVSGWIATTLGEFNGLTHEQFIIDGSGDFSPELCPVESGIMAKLYDIQYAKEGVSRKRCAELCGEDQQILKALSL